MALPHEIPEGACESSGKPGCHSDNLSSYVIEEHFYISANIFFLHRYALLSCIFQIVADNPGSANTRGRNGLSLREAAWWWWLCVMGSPVQRRGHIASLFRVKVTACVCPMEQRCVLFGKGSWRGEGSLCSFLCVLF